MEKKKKKNRLYFYSIILLFLVLVSTVLGIFHLYWWYYPIGVVMGLITHLLMVIQNRRFYRIQKNDVEKVLFHPKKDSFLWYGLRILVILLFLAIVYILAYNFHKDRLLETTLMVLGGFMTVKVVFIIILIIFKEGR